MRLLTKFNLILIFVLGLGFAALSWFTHTTLQANARKDVLARAGLMMDSAGAIRGYTVDEIRPLLKLQMKRAFLPQTVPAYAATQAFEQLQKGNPDYMYKEATLNPTNPRDRAVDWEADVIALFRNHADMDQFTGERDTPSGRSQFLARPIRITNEGCLTCHSVPEAAPQTMIEKYGSANGFGWQHNEVVGHRSFQCPRGVDPGGGEGTCRVHDRTDRGFCVDRGAVEPVSVLPRGATDTPDVGRRGGHQHG